MKYAILYEGRNPSCGIYDSECELEAENEQSAKEKLHRMYKGIKILKVKEIK